MRRFGSAFGRGFGATPWSERSHSAPRWRDRTASNWQIRYLEDEKDPAEHTRILEALDAEPQPLTKTERQRWLAAFDDIALTSDGYIPFRNDIDEAAKHGVRDITEPGGSTRNADVADACTEHGITLAHTGIRLFHH